MKYTTRLGVARAVHFLATPLNRLTLWAARVIVEDRLRKQGLWNDQG